MNVAADLVVAVADGKEKAVREAEARKEGVAEPVVADNVKVSRRLRQALWNPLEDTNLKTLMGPISIDIPFATLLPQCPV